MTNILNKKRILLFGIPILAAAGLLLAQSGKVYAMGTATMHGTGTGNHGQMMKQMKDMWKNPETREEMKTMMQEHHGTNWQTHHQQMLGSDS